MRYVVFLRGINVGGRTIKMADLRQCFERHGYRNVVTVLQTGNVLVDSDKPDVSKLRAAIETMLKTAFDYPARVMVIPGEKLHAVIDAYPFQDVSDHEQKYIVFTEGETHNLLADIRLDSKLEAVQAGEDVIYWKVQKGRTLDSDFAKLMPKLLQGRFVTNRNLNTLQKIIAKA